MSLASALNHLVTLVRPTQSQGGSGGQINTFAEDGTAKSIGCSIQPASATTMLRYMQREVIVSHTLYFDQDWKPTLGCYWLLDENQATDGRKFKVKGWKNECEVDDVWVCDAEETFVPLAFGVNK